MDYHLTPPRPAAGAPALAGLHREAERLVADDQALSMVMPQDRRDCSVQQHMVAMELIASNLIEGLTAAHSRETAAFAALQDARETLIAAESADPNEWIDALCRAHGRLAAAGVVDGGPAGGFRREDVAVAHHVAPPAAAVAGLMGDWAAAYGRTPASTAAAVLDALCAHHRLLFIHPFRDGNGRIARLDLEVRLQAAGLHCGATWSLSAGLLRAEARYRAALAQADAPRRGDLDGRGALSEAGLVDYCEAMLDLIHREITRRYSRAAKRARPDQEAPREEAPWNCG
ncbi:Fic family protein [Aquisalimonas lutea]|uniref:Fic family protein n=1 Tax=Aquisalimonas lutea TaxID=1327750 RepID=UPI0025B370F2|nr:Fic family protein [Aquisalimonas lutea]MDN3517261.1 Fic family protein [Aquisalimonas lutea]